MKKLVWYVEDKGGLVLAEYRTRRQARDMKEFYGQNIFEEWMDDVKFPLKVIREEWELKDRKVVR